MNRRELVADVAARADTGEEVVDTVLAALDEALLAATRRHERVSMPGLLTLEHIPRPARTGRNPIDGTPVQVPPAVVPKIRIGSRMKDAAGLHR